MLRYSILSLSFLAICPSLPVFGMNTSQVRVTQEIKRELQNKFAGRYVDKDGAALETYDMSNACPVTLGRVIFGLGMVGLSFAGLHHINSKIASMNKDRFVSREIRNLFLKVFIPVTVIGGATTLVENRKQEA
jgi:hypothetical protein